MPVLYNKDMPRNPIVSKKIKDVLQKKHLASVPQILEILEKNGEKYNKTSIYRSLEKLHEKGEICRQTFSGNESLYELRKDHHDHAICKSCKKIVAIECTHKKEEQRIPGFFIDHHHTILYGICSDCLIIKEELRKALNVS
jgi:Fe2+ or Zn2+ uptake regulation protein